MAEKMRKEFTKCPKCGGENFLAKAAQDEVIERGIMPKDYGFYLGLFDGIPADQKKLSTLPIGSTLPAVAAGIDVCLDCGTVFARFVEQGVATIRVTKVPPRFNLPGRLS